MTAATGLRMRVWTARVIRVEDLTPSLRRIVLGGPGLAGFRSTGVGDEYVRLVFPSGGAAEPVLPTVIDGCLDYGSVEMAAMRTYTVRAFDPDAVEVTVDFVIHNGGVASAWAAGAQAGDAVGLNTPSGLYAPPAGLTWQVLVADCAGLPAAARLLETTPADVRTRVVLEVPGAAHRLDLRAGPRTEVQWIHGGNGVAPSRLAEVVRSLPPPDDGTGYIWVAGETGVLRGIRKYLRKELGLPARAFKAVGYWQDHAEVWSRQYEALDDATKAALEAIWDGEGELEDLELRYDERLTELGL